MAPPVDEKYREEIGKARTELESEISEKTARNLLRLAYVYQFSIANHDPDAVESTAKHDKTIEEIHTKHPTITYPDLYRLAGVVAVKKLQGPEIEFVPRREDSPILPDESCLPDLKQSPSKLKDVFRKVQINKPNHIVALYGGLKLATAGDQVENLKFDKCFEKKDSSPSDEPRRQEEGLKSLADRKEDSSPSDEPLLEDQEFSNFVQRYANNKDDFFKDYKEAHTKLSEVSLPSYIENLKKRASQVPRAVGVGVAVAAAVLIFSVFYLINKRRTQHPSQQFQ